MRSSLQQVIHWVQPGARVLDLGCGDGTLMAHLMAHKACTGYGLEIDRDCIISAVSKGVNAIEQNLDEGLSMFGDKTFDTVIMTQALQATQRPDLALAEMLRIGQEAIITFPNFAHISHRIQLGILGRMPVSKALPHQWYDTPNIHLSTFKDFERLCHEQGADIIERQVMTRTGLGQTLARLRPNLLGDLALYRVRGKTR
ncbi:methionine biosynthesis protein MetW [Litorivicinus lipolyticus]|uniref:Methionine biosynthesis protein MetW n=1 Tax=Litorivicinus lipolyticus TaxID=418701 RepID=A0A5Q2Q5I3_9GAMM|nr:methionine biosynthesis protein MetW [Litorivicinus lipolyticus]QGG79229.1 methionine biosynthesis protein MetW [Litorivicinus lipolyticus]